MKYSLLIICTIACCLFSCSSDDYYLEESKFIPDSEITSLPAITEQGLNIFGVLRDKATIRYEENKYPLKVIVQNDTTSFIFDGKDYSDYNDYKITFKITDFIPEEDANLVSLNDVTYNMPNNNISIQITDNNKTIDTDVISGSLTFSNAKNLTIDEEYKGVVLSGTFQFKTIIDNTPTAFSYGRFDVIVGFSNFYNLD